MGMSPYAAYLFSRRMLTAPKAEDATTWLMLLLPVFFCVIAVTLTSSLSFTAQRPAMARIEFLINASYVVMNCTMIVFLACQWVSYEVAISRLDKRYPNIIRVQSLLSHILSAFFLALLTFYGAWRLTRHRSSESANPNSSTAMQQLYCTFILSAAWIITYPSAQARQNHAKWDDFSDAGKYPELQASLRRLANLHIGLLIFGWVVAYLGLTTFCRALSTFQSQVWDYFHPPSNFRHAIATRGYSPHPWARHERRDVEAQSLGNSSVFEMKHLSNVSVVGGGPQDNKASHPVPRAHAASPDSLSQPGPPAPAFIGSQSPSLSSWSTESPNLTPPLPTPSPSQRCFFSSWWSRAST
ncbi:hypothetical protein PAAG_04940 [Paracoccidioides lutzii Pb01]|uniref:Uncharacterized protein n=1 Tax=Paracoccidioides lutzii (strain ATCC MYA-826 / Pb01) TaxID=502779 RepID=C1H204_PARBA|nr:hypothetical protein PAAG_04940 [Paracoccidioides lutzii Pb01]EEH33891.2 hypothetical protein PAAG_04940 [Paracoccidioides lutzii Pb01]